jgi:hypothetical protein
MAIRDYGGQVFPYGTKLAIGAYNYTIAPKPTAPAPKVKYVKAEDVYKNNKTFDPVVLSTPKFGDLTLDGSEFNLTPTITALDDAQMKEWSWQTSPPEKAIGLTFKINGQFFTFHPSNMLEKGFKTENKQFYNRSILSRLDRVYEEGQPVDLANAGWYGKFLTDNDLSTQGVLLPGGDLNYMVSVGGSWKVYDLGTASNGLATWGGIEGIGKVGDEYVYISDVKPSGGASSAYGYVNSKGDIVGEAYTPGKKRGGFVGKVSRAIAGVPLLPEIAGVVTGNPYVYATLKGMQGGATGQDPFKVGLQAGVTVATANLIKSPTFSTSVGKAVLGSAASDTAATIVGASIVGGTSNAIVAAATGGDITKSFVTGAVSSAVLTGSGEVAEALIGKENVASIAEITGLSKANVENVIARSLVDGAIAAANGQDFAAAVGTSLVSGGLSAKAATEVTDALKATVGKSTLAAIGLATSEIVRTGSNAAIAGEDVGKALENAAPGIVLSTVTTAVNTARKEQEQAKKIASGDAVLVAGEPTAEILQSLNAQPTAGEEVVGEGYSEQNDVFVRRVSGVKNDGTQYNYVIHVFDSGNVYYTYLDQNGNPITVEERPNLTSAPSGVGSSPLRIDILGVDTTPVNSVDGAPIEGQLPIRGVLDLRTIISNAVPTGRVAISATGGVTGSGMGERKAGFAFIGQDGQGRDKYQIGGVDFTVITIDGKQVLADNERIVFLEPTVNPVTNVSELTPTPDSAPFVPEEEVLDELERDKLEKDEGVSGKTGETGVAGGAPSGPSQEILDKLEAERVEAERVETQRAEAERAEADRLAVALGRTERTELARTTRAQQERAEFERLQKEFEENLGRLEADLLKAKSEKEELLARRGFATEQRQRLSKLKPFTGSTEAKIQSELDSLLKEYEDAQGRATAAETQKERLVAPQQPGDAGREISDADIMNLLGLSDEEAERYGFEGDVAGVSAGEGPGSAVEGDEIGAADEGDGSGSSDEGAGPGSGSEGSGPGGGAETKTRQARFGGRVIFDRDSAPGSKPFGSGVTGEDLASILSEKEPLFGGDDDEQQAVWNRRSLRLRKALGL